jgi:ubiquinone/menaquinone biosynthesis C-methylase UbiE
MKGWEKVADWYDKLTGEEGHYYQKEIIIPKILHFLKDNKTKKVLDLACGQGVLARALPQGVDYCGVDISSSLIKSAANLKKNNKHSFVIADVTDDTFSLKEKDYDACTVVLALQDVKDVPGFLKNANKHLKSQGIMIIVMNHPCFRIPRQSLWSVDEVHKMQSRQIKAYMSSLEVPIKVNPGQGEQAKEVVYHHQPLSVYSRHLFDAGFSIELIEEWTSNKQSTGPKAKMENRARKEFPLFLCFVCRKR